MQTNPKAYLRRILYTRSLITNSYNFIYVLLIYIIYVFLTYIIYVFLTYIILIKYKIFLRQLRF